MSESSVEPDLGPRLSDRSDDLSAEWPTISVIAPMYNEYSFLPQFIDAMMKQDYPKDRYEVLLIDGGSQDGTLKLADQAARQHSIFRILSNPDRYLPQAENIGVREARGSLIARADIHAGYPANYLSSCVGALRTHGASCVGGILSTQPGAPTTTARAIAIVQSHPFGVGNSQARVGTQARVVDSVAFPCLRKSVFQEVGLYNELMPRHEDVELYSRIRRAGGTLVVDPSIQATYYARPTVGSLLKQAWQNGHETPIACLANPSCARIRHWIPGLFVGSLIGLAAAAVFAVPARWLLAVEVGTYLLAALAATASVILRHGWGAAPLVSITFVLHHLAYGMGTCFGLWRLVKDWRKVRAYRVPTLDEPKTWPPSPPSPSQSQSPSSQSSPPPQGR